MPQARHVGWRLATLSILTPRQRVLQWWVAAQTILGQHNWIVVARWHYVDSLSKTISTCIFGQVEFEADLYKSQFCPIIDKTSFHLRQRVPLISEHLWQQRVPPIDTDEQLWKLLTTSSTDGYQWAPQILVHPSNFIMKLGWGDLQHLPCLVAQMSITGDTAKYT